MRIVIAGCGRVGSDLADTLSEEGHDVSVIDADADSFQMLGGTFNGTVHVGRAYDVQVLKEAGIEFADAFVAVTNGDNANAMAVQVARSVFGVHETIARLDDPARIEAYRALDIRYVAASRLTSRIYPKYIIQVGLVLLFVGGFILARSIETATEASDMALGLLIGGLAIGIIAGQLPNLILSGVEPDEASEASGLQGTAQNLGMALGTAVIGTVILSVSFSSMGSRVSESPTIPQDTKVQITSALESGLNEANRQEIDDAIAASAPEVQNEIDTAYHAAVLDGFQGAIIIGGIVALFGALLAFRLPKQKLPGDAGVEEVIRQTVRSPTIPAMQLEMDDLPRKTRL